MSSLRVCRALIAAIALIAALAVSGCGDESGGGDGGRTAGGTKKTAASFTFALPSAPANLDIARNYDTLIMQIMTLSTEPLERLTQSGELEPNLAASVSEPDDRTIVYELRPDARFSDGTPVTPEDVAWSIEHTFERGTQTATQTVTSIASVETGENQVTVNLRRPDPTTRQNIAFLAFIQQKRFAEAHPRDLGAPGAEPIGTGPYMIATNTPDSITLERNPHYWGEDPAPERVSFKFIPTDTTAQLAMRSGELQGALVHDLKTGPAWEAIDGTKLESLPSLTSIYISMDVANPPFDDVHVRRAIAHAIDRENLVVDLYGENAILLRSLLPAGAFSYVAGGEEEAQSYLDSLPQYEFDLDKARAELAQSRYADGLEFELTYITGAAWSKLSALNLEQNLKQIGVEVKLRAVSQAQWGATIVGHRNLGIQLMEGFSAPPDPNGGLVHVIGRETAVENSYNTSNWTTPEVEEARETLINSGDQAARYEATKTILSLIQEQLPYVPLYSPELVVAIGGGFGFGELPTQLDLTSGAWVSKLTYE